MKAQLLKSPPISGTYDERWYDAVGNCRWVLFEDENYEDWVGVFGQGDWTRFSTALVFSASMSALVVSCGKGYVVDVNSGELYYHTECDSLVGAIGVPNRDLIIGCDFRYLYALTSKGQIWSECIAFDGIQLEQATPDGLLGRAWQIEGWHRFSLKFDGWKYVQEQLP